MADNFNSRLYARGYSSSVTTRQPSAPPGQAVMCAPACATCGLLECLCRPRFFAGQLLTEVDLNRLDAYIRAKNRMHNVQLHGWGVVNGLQVRCDACGSGVIVGTGYAIDPCGEDIVVCNDTPVDICALIKRCQQVDITCVPSTMTSSSNYYNANSCDDVEEDWVLAIRYSETQARGVTALKSSPSCACGAKAGPCGCGMPSPQSTPAPKPRSTPTECEATAICEGYAFDAYLAPPDVVGKDSKQLSGGLIDAMRCCLDPLIAALPKPPSDQWANFGQNAIAWNLWCCRTKEAMIAFFSTGPQANCTLVEKLRGASCPSPDDQNFEAQMTFAIEALALLLIEAMFACFCAALLPPAPCGTSDDRVPLAIVTVRKRDCKVLRVCNWTQLRKLVITMPTLEYWLGWIPWFRSIQDTIGTFCCSDFRLPQRDPATTTGTFTPAGTLDASPTSATYGAANMKVNPYLDPKLAQDNRTMTTLLMNAFARGTSPMDARTIVNGLFGVGPRGKTELSDTEKANVGPFLLLDQVLRPVAASALTDDVASLHRRITALEQALANTSEKKQ